MADKSPGGSAFDALNSLTSLTGALGSGVKDAAGALVGMESTLKGILKSAGAFYSYWEKINTNVLNVSKNFGGSLKSFKQAGSYTSMLSNNLEGANYKLAEMGSSIEEVSKLVGELTENSGSFVGMSQKGAENYAHLKNLIDKTTLDPLSKDLVSIGYSFESSTEAIAEMQQMAVKAGLNANVVVGVMQKNLSALSRYSFKGGAKEMEKMATSSVTLGVDLGVALSKMKELRSPEKAIEFSQKMQMLGGSFSQLFGDATETLRMSRNDPEKFVKSLGKAASELVTMNEDGSFAILGDDIDRADAAAAELGTDFETVKKAGIEVAKMKSLKDKFNLNVPEEDLKAISGLVDFTKSTGGKLQFSGLDDATKLKFGIDDKGLIDATNFSSEKAAQLAKDLRGIEENKAKTAENKAKTAMEAAEKQAQASINLTDKLSRLGDQVIALSPNVAKIANNKTIGDDLKGSVDSLKKILESTNVKDSMGEIAEGLVDKGAEITSDINKNLKLVAASIETSGFDFVDVMKKVKVYFEEFKKNLLKEDKEHGGIVKYGSGGLFNGPSHKEGGIPVTTKGSGNMFEVEGGEAIINKKSTAMFKPLLSSINELGGGVKFAMGGISSPMASRSTQMGSNGTSNINVGSSSPININVNVNGSVAIDGKNFKISDEEKEKLSISIKNTFMSEVFSNITKGEAFTGKKTNPNYIFNA